MKKLTGYLAKEKRHFFYEETGLKYCDRVDGNDSTMNGCYEVVECKEEFFELIDKRIKHIQGTYKDISFYVNVSDITTTISNDIFSKKDDHFTRSSKSVHYIDFSSPDGEKILKFVTNVLSVTDAIISVRLSFHPQ